MKPFALDAESLCSYVKDLFPRNRNNGWIHKEQTHLSMHRSSQKDGNGSGNNDKKMT
jgi:hypothetical protein